MKVRAHVYISGRVQGVFFRSETKEKADEYGVKGWVRNLPDGRVEAIFEGEKEKVDKIIEFCRHGPPGAIVKNIEIIWEEWRGEFKDFRIKYGFNQD
jgi:acylphosphatase